MNSSSKQYMLKVEDLQLECLTQFESFISFTYANTFTHHK